MRSGTEIAGRWLAVLRMYTGIFWLIHGIPKWMPGAPFVARFGETTQKLAAGSTGAYHSYLVSVVLPNASLFGNLLRAGEVLVGISLLFGLLTRMGALGGMFLALNYMLAKNAMGSIDTYASLDAAAFVLSFMHLVLPSGYVWGLDRALRRRRR
ncbi:MAG: hypothetical protein DLM50_09680 [Candidatus Meridianibacter frigidus]|nr:MAG: hypothetical protein DLM50_09680 [Candidatus Eremiobacteraeota bacterium]